MSLRWISVGDYAGIVDLLDMRLTNENRLDFGFYQEAEEKLREDDWSDFEKKFIASVRKKEQPYQFHRDNSLLAQIYDYKGNTDDLWKTVKGSSIL